MTFWTPIAVRAYAPAIVGWWLAVAGGLRLEELRLDPRAQLLVPALQWSVGGLLLLTFGAIVAASVVLWRAGRRVS